MAIADTNSSDPLPHGALTESSLRTHVWPLFSRVLAEGPKHIYLANHSLGRPLDQTSRDVQEALDAWYATLDHAWGPWMDEIQRFRASIATLIGAHRPDCIVPKTAAGQGLRAVLNSFDDVPRVVATAGEFDSMDFILRTYHHKGRAKVRWVSQRAAADVLSTPRVVAEDVIAAIREEKPQLVLVSHAYFTTGQVLDPAPIIAAAHESGSLVMLDCYHSAGVIPVRFAELDADFAVGGSYKYTRGGPGACWLAVHPRHLPTGDMPEREGKLRTLDTGWFAKKDTFRYERPDEPLLSAGGDAWLESTPAILPFYQARAGLALTLAIGVERLRAYSLEQQAFLASELSARGVRVIGPGADRGAYVLLPRADAPQFCQRLLATGRGVNADSRQGLVRFCPDILTTREDMREAAEIIAGVVGSTP
jgi:kynureninase